MRAQLAYLSVATAAAFLVAAGAAEVLEEGEENAGGVCSYSEAESELCTDNRGWLSAKGGLGFSATFVNLFKYIYIYCFVS